MKILYFFMLLLLVSCNNTIRLAVPTVFKDQATLYKVVGSKKNKMDVGSFKSTRIKRGLQMSYPVWGRGFFMENLLLGIVGLQKTENVRKEKGKFRFSISDGLQAAQVFGKETALTKSIEYSLTRNKNSFLNSFEQMQEYQYIFSALIHLNDSSEDKTWELLMTNIYDRAKDPDPKMFVALKPDDNGIVTNGIDSFFIKAISLRETENKKGKKGKLPFKVLGGYEVRTSDGVAAIVDIIGSNVWFYNELEQKDRLIIAAMATAIFARRVNDATW